MMFFASFFSTLTNDQHLWRELWSAQPFDDPLTCVSPIGRRRTDPFDWKGELQIIIRARTILENISLCKPHERCTTLQTLLNLASWVPPLKTQSDNDNVSQNILWVFALTRGGNFIDHRRIPWEQDEEERQLRAKLHTILGILPMDLENEAIIQARAVVYSMRNYTWANEFGPFKADGRVNWEHVKAIHHTISMHLLPPIEDMDFLMLLYPLSAPRSQIVIPQGVDLDQEDDWAGVEGYWNVSFCFCDHHLLIRYNSSAAPPAPLDNMYISDPLFREVFRTLEVKLHVTRVVPDSKHPGRPQIYFVGVMSHPSTSIMNGYVKMTDDGHVRWHFVSGESGNAIWSCEGVQVGGVRSAYGVLGSWTTIFHDVDDPVGPFLLQKLEIPDLAGVEPAGPAHAFIKARSRPGRESSAIREKVRYPHLDYSSSLSFPYHKYLRTSCSPMSDQPSPPKPKPGSLRDRIAAFEKPAQQASSNAPPPPRPKPGNIPWKPRQLSPPTSPAAADDSTSASGSGSGSGSGATEGSSYKKFGSGMSASDAKESITKGGGGSLKERMAALQGKGGFGAPPPLAPKPAVEKPKWKPPPQVVKAGGDDDDDDNEDGNKPKPVDTEPKDKEEGGEERVKSPDASSVKSGEESVGAEADASEEAGEPDPEEEERQRRAAIAARMAKLGGARVGMGPPVFGRPMVPKKPEVMKSPPATQPTPSQEVKEEVKEDVSNTEPSAAAADGEPLKSPPSIVEEAGTAEEKDTTKSVPDEERKASAATDSSSLLSPDSNASSPPARTTPTSMPLPAAPRRAGPPRRKVKSPVPEPEPEAVSEPVAEPASESLAIGTEEGDITAAPDKEPEESTTTKEERERAHAEPSTQTRDSVDSGSAAAGGPPGGGVEEEETGHAPPIHAHMESAPESPEKVLSDEKLVAEEPKPVAEERDTSVDIVEQHKDAGELEQQLESEETREEEIKGSAAEPVAAGEREVEEKHEYEQSKEQEQVHEEEEEDEETRRKRIAERVAKMGGFNPFSLPPKPQRRPSEDPSSPVSVSSTSQKRTSGISLTKEEREGSIGSVEQQNIRKSSMDSSSGSFPPPPVRRSSQMSAKSVSVASPTSPPARKPSVDSTHLEGVGKQGDDHALSAAASKHITPSGITEEPHDDEDEDDSIPVPVHRASISENKATEEHEDDTRFRNLEGKDESAPRPASISSPPPMNLSSRPPAPARQASTSSNASAAPIFVPPPPPKMSPPDDGAAAVSSPQSDRAVPPPPAVPEDYDVEEPAPPVPQRRSIPPPPRMIPQPSEEQEYTDAEAERKEPHTAVSHGHVEESASPIAVPVPEPRRLPPRRVHDDEGENSDSSVPLPHPHRRSIPTLAPSQASDVEDDVAAKVILPRRMVPPPPPVSAIEPGSDDDDDDEEVPHAREEKEEILPTPPRRAVTPERRSPQQEPLIVPPPPVPAQTRPDSIAERRSVPVPAIPQARVAAEPESVQPSVLSPSLSVSEEDSEVLDEDEGAYSSICIDADPIDPSFHSPSRRASALNLQSASPPPSAPSFGTEPAPAAQPEEPVEDEETVRRRTIAERMAKLGGIRFGAAPIPTSRPAPPPKRATEDDEGQYEDVAEEAPSELTEEEEERARKERIAAKLASMGGMRIGMMPGTMPPRPPPVRTPSVPVESPTSPASASAAPRVPPHRAVPPPVPQSLSHSQEFDSEHESQANSEDGVKVEAEESEIEEVNYEDVEEEAPPPPVPTREGRRVPSGDHAGRPTQPSSRPPVPTALPRRTSTDTTTTRKSSTGSTQNYQTAYQKPHSDYVMVEDPEPAEPVPPRITSRPPPARAPPPPGPPSAGIDPSDSQWEMPSAPTAESVAAPKRTSGRPPARAPPPPGPSSPGMEPAESQWEMPTIPSVDFGRNADLSLSWNESDIPAPVKEPSAPPAPAANQVLSSDDLMAIWGRVGVQICEVATALHDKSKKALIGDGTYHGFVTATLKEVPNTAPISPNSYGYLIYQQSGSAVQKRVSDILPGDILWMQDAKLKGHKGIQTYHQSVGVGDPLVGVVSEFEAKKFKVRVFQANQHVGQQVSSALSREG
ncbi:hypothetical protein D9758_013144 [Tetrapyrgos nigripes]|uniref:BBC1/AIM3 cysteine proteinase-fold domain-containing protein n=1 Tax=Tetrapyrgos nigripes TaxID=182062 RepID=A0A8H5CE82_9AGAR|nr:hypothetical protein D9758_013144 [Tetrapyrgos nigripes]